MTKEKRKRHVDIIRMCPKCENTKDVIVLAGMGAKFFFCPVCSPKKQADEKEPKLALEE